MNMKSKIFGATVVWVFFVLTVCESTDGRKGWEWEQFVQILHTKTTRFLCLQTWRKQDISQQMWPNSSTV